MDNEIIDEVFLIFDYDLVKNTNQICEIWSDKNAALAREVALHRLKKNKNHQFNIFRFDLKGNEDLFLARHIRFQQLNRPELAPKNIPADELGNWIDNLFKHFEALFISARSLMKNHADRERTKITWYNELVKKDLTIRELKRGMEMVMQSGSPFMPSLPAFLNWCQPNPTHFGEIRGYEEEDDSEDEAN